MVLETLAFIDKMETCELGIKVVRGRGCSLVTDQMTVTNGCCSLWVTAILGGTAQSDLHLIQANILFSALDEDFEMYLLFHLYCHHSSSNHHHLSSLKAFSLALFQSVSTEEGAEHSQNTHLIESLHASVASDSSQKKT